MTASRRRRQAAPVAEGSASGARAIAITEIAENPRDGEGLLEKLDRLATRMAALEEALAAAEALEAVTRSGYHAAVIELMAQLAEARRAPEAPPPGRRFPFGKPAPAANPLFDSAFYLGQQPDLVAGEAPEAHYHRVGWRQGLRPHPLFDPAWYLAQNPDVADAGLEPLAHYIQCGAAEGRAPSPWFDVAAYRALRGAALAPDANPLIDYLQGGAWRSFPLPQDPTLLLQLAQEGRTPLEHWAQLG